MSLQGLISGAECAMPANPLSQVLKHTEGDRSVQQDRVAGPSSSRLRHLPGSSSHTFPQQDAALAQSFFQGSSAPQNFQITHQAPRPLLPAESAGVHHRAGQSVDLNGAWSTRTVVHAPSPAQWASEFNMRQEPGVAAPGPSELSSSFGTSYAPARSYAPTPLGMHGMNSSFYGINSPSPMQYDQGKGKGKANAADFDAAFADAAASFNLAQTGSARISEVDDEVTGLEAALNATSLNDHADTIGDVDPTLAKWEAEFQEMMDARRNDGEYDYGAAMQEAWESGVGNFADTEGMHGVQYDDEGIPALDEYAFETKNRFTSSPESGRSLLDGAKALLDASGSLSEVALMLEAAIQKGELGEGGYESWLLLGETLSMDEREDAAIQALAEGVNRAKANGPAGAGMLSLAIAYTNEAYERASLTMLLRWLQAKYPSLSIPEETLKSVTQSAWHSSPLIMDAFLDLARSQNASGVVDADVQMALGVLLYSKGDYEHASDCFSSALSVQPSDFRLWNRYGSCLSNGNRPEESLSAYQEALRQRPTYTRAVYNVAVACMNIGAHQEAVEHLLGALAGQESAGKETSEQLWTTLRRAFSIMNRSDLADLAKERANLDVFRKEFDLAPVSGRGSSLSDGPADWHSASGVTA